MITRRKNGCVHILIDILIVFVFAGLSQAQMIKVEPKDGLADERLTIQVTGLKPKQPVIIRASMKDADEQLWQSHAGFYADQNGVVDLSKQAPVNGDYTGIDAMGLIFSMDLDLPLENRRYFESFVWLTLNPLTIRFSLEVDDKKVQSTEVIRRFLQPDIEVKEVRESSLVEPMIRYGLLTKCQK